MKKLLFILAVLLVFALFSCTDQQRARSWGGTENISIESHEKFINMTWKQDNLWVLVYDTQIQKYVFKEYSSWDMLEGKIIVDVQPSDIPKGSFKSIK